MYYRNIRYLLIYTEEICKCAVETSNIKNKIYPSKK